jgi:PIN domain nuclease of toxin-antitoxin system
MVLLDTHAWVWWLTKPELVPKKATQAIRAAMREYAVHISTMSAWEIAMLVARGRLELATDYREFIRQTEKLAFVKFIAPHNTILLNSVEMPGYEGKDPADRIIIATANHLSATLITKDDTMLEYRQVRTTWD